MPIRTIPNSNVTYSLIAFDARGRERKDDPHGIGGLMSARIIQDARANPPSHIFFFSHGWKGDVPAAIDQYNRWIKAMIDLPGDSAAMGPGFKPLWIGLHWPSQPWGDDELGSNSFEASSVSSNELVERYVNRLGGDPEEVRKLLHVIFHENDINAGAIELPAHVVEAYNSLAGAIGRTSAGPEAAPGDDDAPFDAVAAFDAANEAGDAFGGLSLGGLLGPLRQLSFWTMKSRARTVGEAGMHSFIAALQQALPSARLHLMGHSFGCIVVSSILGGPGGKASLPRTVDSVVLVQGAVSLWAYADSILGTPKKGYFNAAIKRGAVRGPILTTLSRHDTAIGVIYPVAAGLSGQVDFLAQLPRFGGIGAYGLQGLGGVNAIKMLPHTGSYGFVPGGIYNIESSEFISKRDGASGAHSDIDGPQVAHAIWQAAQV